MGGGGGGGGHALRGGQQVIRIGTESVGRQRRSNQLGTTRWWRPLLITAGTKETLYPRGSGARLRAVDKAAELSGVPGLLFRRHSRPGRGGGGPDRTGDPLNPALHAHAEPPAPGRVGWARGSGTGSGASH
jgi:hypothetical protein